MKETETLIIMCSLDKQGLLPNWAYYLDWMSEEARMVALEIMYRQCNNPTHQ